MQFYFYRIDRKIMVAKWSRALALLLRKEGWEILKSLVLEVFKERLRRGQWARRRAHRSSASGRSGAPKLTGKGAKRRGEHGELV
jgi:hypothetical protein